jgi:hypothetical protein
MLSDNLRDAREEAFTGKLTKAPNHTSCWIWVSTWHRITALAPISLCFPNAGGPRSAIAFSKTEWPARRPAKELFAGEHVGPGEDRFPDLFRILGNVQGQVPECF